MKKRLRIRKRGVLILINCICITAMMINACWMFIECMSRNFSFSYMLDESNTTESFEETEVFTELFQNAIGDAVRYSVICEQLESNGELDGKKLIDIEQYANHKSMAANAEISVSYFLEDLVKWGQMNYYTYKSITEDEYQDLYNYANALMVEQDKTGTSNNLIDSDDNETVTIVPPEPSSEGNSETEPATGNSLFEEQNTAEETEMDVSASASVQAAAEANIQEIYQYNGLLDREETADGTTSASVQPETRSETNSEAETEDSSSDTTDAATNFSAEFTVGENGAAVDSGTPTNSTGAPYYPVMYEEIFFPADGQYLILHTDSLEQYADYTSFLFSSIQMIYSNFKEYRELGEELERSNFKFYISVEDEGVRNTYTNYLSKAVLDENITASEITEMFRENGKFIYSDYENLSEPITDTLISNEFIWDEIGRYYYSLSGNVKLWFGVDTTYSESDVFSDYKASYRENFVLFRNVFIMTIVLLIFILILFIALSVYETPSKKKVRGIDRLHTEFSALIAIALLVGILGGTAVLIQHCMEGSIAIIGHYNEVPRALLLVIMGVGSLIASIVAISFYLSLVRRLKAHTIWNNSVCKRIYDLLVYLSNHPKIFVRTWVPYLLFLGGNLYLMYVIFDNKNSSTSVLAILTLVIVDMLLGYSNYRGNETRREIIRGIAEIQNGNFSHKLDTTDMRGDSLAIAESINRLGESISSAVGVSMKDERMKTDLITNVSHDIKTPLTSIISYIDLIKRENIQNEKVKEYVNILDNKSQRLKQLTDDLVEASKISSGNIVLDMNKLNFNQLIKQTLGEFDERFKKKGLEIVLNIPEEPTYILADSRRIWRVIENLYSNIIKYALQNTRVYIDLKAGDPITLAVKNISAQELNIDAAELTERFIRGDISRSSEGSGLGLSIAKDLTVAQNGKFDIYLDGDLFKVIISFHPYVEDTEEMSENVVDNT